MEKTIQILAKEAGFAFWGNEDHKPKNATIDWSSEYDEELNRFFYLTKGHVLRNCMSQVLADMFHELREVELEGIRTDEYEEGFWDAIAKVRERLLHYRANNKIY